MKSIIKNALTLVITLIALNSFGQSSKYKCMLQMANYTGEGAYIAISVINPQGQYEKTLAILGDDNEWYKTLKEWHKFQSKKKANLRHQG